MQLKAWVSKTMKFVVAVYLLAVLLVSSTARVVSPGFTDWQKHAKPRDVGDIWSDCSKWKYPCA